MSLLRMNNRDRALYVAKTTPKALPKHGIYVHMFGKEHCDLIWDTIAAYGLRDTTTVVNTRPPFSVLEGHDIRGALIVRRMTRAEVWFRNLFRRVKAWFT